MVDEKRTTGAAETVTRAVATWLPPLAWMLFIYLISGAPKEDIPQLGGWDLLVKKGGHLAAYGVLATLWLRALERHRAANWLALVICFLYAISDEYHQSFVPGRNGNTLDVMVDSAGALIGMAIWRWSHTRVRPAAG